jgi:hypothetical protein
MRQRIDTGYWSLDSGENGKKSNYYPASSIQNQASATIEARKFL